jgi:hypothetical protein
MQSIRAAAFFAAGSSVAAFRTAHHDSHIHPLLGLAPVFGARPSSAVKNLRALALSAIGGPVFFGAT